MLEMLNRHIGAQYVYADSTSQANDRALEAMSPDEARTALHNIPDELVMRLSEGTLLGNVTMIDRSIADIRQHHSRLAETLNRMARRFQFDELLALLRKEENV